jgi:hypothetical protein
MSPPAPDPPRRGFLRRRFARWLALGQYGFPFALGPFPTPVARFRAVARRTRFAGHPYLRVVPRVAMALGWPVGALSTAIGTRRRMRQRGQAPHGGRVLIDMYWLALRHSIPPLEYALYGFNDPARRADMHHYVYWNDLPGLAALNAGRGADTRDVQDKDRFAAICAAHGLPHVPTLAVFASGRQRFPDAPFVPDAPALWTKALRLKGGAGGARWIRGDAGYRNARGRLVPADRLADELRGQDCLVQPFVHNHPDVARITNGALASLRIVTGLDERGGAEFVAALLALPHGARDSSVAGILCSLDPGTGRIRHAALPGGEPILHHPDTGASLVGLALPWWTEGLDLVRRAHATAFPGFPFLGWDLALTDAGPLLLETNAGWGAIFHQMLDGPLGHTAFSRLVARYV